MRRRYVAAVAVLVLAACSRDTSLGPNGLEPPTDLSYQLIPSGDPAVPTGIELRWEPVSDPNVTNYVVYSRASSADSWNRRAETTSPSFEDLGVPDLQYYVTSEAGDGTESDPSNVVVVDPANQLDAPATLSSISLNGAVALSWSSNARTAAPDEFQDYRVYSTEYDVAENLCATDWVLEGTTVSEDFVASGLSNGVSRCFAVSAVSFDGHESEWSPPRNDTPRFDARNVLMYVSQSSADSSGFSFFAPSTADIGVVLAPTSPDADFRLDRHTDGSLWMVPLSPGTVVATYGDRPVDDLTSIDFGAVTGFAATPIEAVVGWGYVYRTSLTDGRHYGALRVTHTAPDFMIFDWAYQTDPNNPELVRVRRH